MAFIEPVNNTNLNAATDSPRLARVDLLDLVDKFNIAALAVPYIVSRYASLTAAVADIGSTPTVLLINADTTCTADTVVPATLHLAWLGSYQIDRGAFALTINSPMPPIVAHLFEGTGTITFTKVDEAYSEWFGDTGTGADDTTKIQLALNSGAKATKLLDRTYSAGALTVPVDTMLTGKGYASVIQKRSNCDQITLSARATVSDFRMEGQGATYTGSGIVVADGALDNISWRKIRSMHILGMANHCIEFTQARAGYSSSIHDCRFTLAGANQYTNGCVKLPTGEANNGNRFMSDCWSFNYHLFDAGECDNFEVVNCQGGYPILSADTKKLNMSNCRIIGNADIGTTWTITGQLSTFSNINTASLDIIFDAACANIKWGGIIPTPATITDNAPGVSAGNEITYDQQIYTPAWTASSGTPAIGSGTLNGAYARHNEYALLNIQFATHTDSTLGTDVWTFEAPFNASRNDVGSVYIINAAGTVVYTGTCVIASGTKNIRMITNKDTDAFVGHAKPFAWANGDTMYVQLTYAIE